MVKKLLQKFRHWRFPYTPLVEITIFKDRLLHNLHTFQNINPALTIAPVLKADAYGHGIGLIAKIVDGEKIPFIVVDSYHEALILRNENVRSPILMIGYTALENILKNKLKRVAFTVTSLGQLEEISKNLTRPTRFHLKIDTGMHRQGILVQEISRATELVRANSKICLEGVSSHLADADRETSEFTDTQIKIWNELVKTWKKEFPDTKYFHLSATSGALLSEAITANVLRLGIGLYGIDPTQNVRIPKLKPVLEMKSILSGTKTIEKGEKIGYGGTFQAPNTMRIATIPAGYYEGIDRRLSNKGFVKIGYHFCPIVGRVSMNITAIDVTDVPEATLNTPVVIVSSNSEDKNCLNKSAELAGTIPYELLVHIPQGLRRKVI